MDEHGRAVELELTVAELFSSHGYEVRHNVWLRGRSGVKHQVDVYAVYKAPLHTDRIIIECKAYGRPVDKDRVMKLAQVVQDLGAEKGILVTTSRFTSAAEATARGLNIDLWDGATLARMLSQGSFKTVASIHGSMVHYIHPAISEDRAGSVAKRKLGGLLSPSLKTCLLVFHPLYIMREARASERRTGLLSKNSIVEVKDEILVMNALTGSQYRCSEGGIWIGRGACMEPVETWMEGAPPYGILLKPGREPQGAGWSLLYYPYYACILGKKGRVFLVAVDGVLGNPDPEASRLYAGEEVYRAIREEAESLGLLN